MYKIGNGGHSKTVASRLPRDKHLASDLVDGSGQTLHVASCDAGNGYSAVLGSIHRMLLLISGRAKNGCMQHTSFANWSICSGFRPVYANMPI